MLIRLQAALDEIDDRTSTTPSSSIKSTTELYKPASFLLYIDCPKDRAGDCAKVVEAIGLRGDKNPVQILTDLSMLPPSFQPITDIVRLSKEGTHTQKPH